MHRRDGPASVKLAVRGLLEEFEATLCGPVEMEYLGEAPLAERERLQAWCTVLPYLGNDQKLWRQAAVHFARLRKEGVTAPWNDVLVATIALEAGCRVYACDPHFAAMAPILNLRLYEPGPGGSFNPE